jgi:hypothetical protein
MRVLRLAPVACLMVVSAQDRNTCGPDWTNDQKEKFLLAAAIDSRRSAPRGVTDSVRAKLKASDCLHDAHIQHIDEWKLSFQTQRGTEFNFRDSYKFNVAAYLLDRILDLHMIPPSVPRNYQGRSAAFTWWVDDFLMDEMTRTQRKIVPPDKDRWNRQMWIVRVFDQLIANTDRNLGNLVITKDWTLWMIDHTRAFRTATDLPNPKNLEKCDRVLLERLRALDPAIVQRELQPYLTKMEMAGLLARRAKLVAFFDEKCAREGQGAALFEYLSQRDAHVAGGARVMPAAAPK